LATPGHVVAADSAERRLPNPTIPTFVCPDAATSATTWGAVIAPGTAGIVAIAAHA